MLSSTAVSVTMVPLVSCIWTDELAVQLVVLLRGQMPVTHHNGGNVNKEGTVRTRMLPVDLLEMRLKV